MIFNNLPTCTIKFKTDINGVALSEHCTTSSQNHQKETVMDSMLMWMCDRDILVTETLAGANVDCPNGILLISLC